MSTYWVVCLRIFGRVGQIARSISMSGCDELMGEKRQLLEERLEYSIQNQRRKEGMAEMS
jgi:hypothetical protein